MLELDHVTIAYGENQAVEDFSLHMELVRSSVWWARAAAGKPA